MMYATVEQVQAGFRPLDEDDQARCLALLEEAAVMIDACSPPASADAKRLVSCRMVRRVLGTGAAADVTFAPMGAQQGSASALGYSQSWTMGGGAVGELYLSKLEKMLLGMGDRIGSGSPLEELCHDSGN